MDASHRKKAIRSKVLLGAANVALFYLLYRWLANNIDFDQLQHLLRQIPLWAVLLSMSLNLSALAFYGLRMKLLLQRGFTESFAIINIGYVLNTLVPLRLGEFLKVWIVHRLYGLSLTAIVTASVAEKVFDLLKLLLLCGGVVAFAAGKFIPGGLAPSLALFLAVCVGAYVLARKNASTIVRLLPKKSRLRPLLVSLYRHADTYPLRKLFGVSVMIWGLNVLLMYATFNSFLHGVHVSWVDAIMLLLIISLAIAIPSAPAGIGLFEAGLVAYLTQVLHVEPEAALAASVMFHLVITIPQMGLAAGLVLISRKAARHG